MQEHLSPSLIELGWDSDFELEMSPFVNEGLVPARITRQDKGIYTVLGQFGRTAAELSGRIQHEADSRAQLPAVGDWVALRLQQQGEGRAIIHAVLSRRSFFSRKEAGKRTGEQVLCANIDTAFIVSSLVGERGFVPRRIERYLTMVQNADVDPVILLNKQDLCKKFEKCVFQTEEVAPGVPVYAVSALTGEGIPSVVNHLEPGKTGVLVGPSGVGKSSLINALLGKESVKTGPVRPEDGRGRHVTSWRELIVIPGHGIIIDTPGMRELQLWAEDGALEGSFADIVDLTQKCRFRDCTHGSEPGCAVQKAVKDGDLEAARLDSYFRQQDELHYLELRKDQHARKIEQDKWKSIHKSVKTLNKIDPKRKWEKGS